MQRITYTAQNAGRPREIAPGVFLEIPGTAEFPDVDLDGRQCDVTLVLDMTPEGVRAVKVLVASKDGSPVSSTTLRAVKVQQLTRAALQTGVQHGELSGEASGPWAFTSLGRRLTQERAAELRAQGPTDETLRWVAFFYNLGTVCGLPPAKSVEVAIGLPRTTASKWVRRARENGLLNDKSHDDISEHSHGIDPEAP